MLRAHETKTVVLDKYFSARADNRRDVTPHGSAMMETEQQPHSGIAVQYKGQHYTSGAPGATPKKKNLMSLTMRLCSAPEHMCHMALNTFTLRSGLRPVKYAIHVSAGHVNMATVRRGRCYCSAKGGHPASHLECPDPGSSSAEVLPSCRR